MVGIVRIELTTPCVSSKCSTTELDALKKLIVVGDERLELPTLSV